MAAQHLLVLFIAATTYSALVSCADPDPLDDFCVADLSSSLVTFNGAYLCKNISAVTVDDFVTTKLRHVSTATQRGRFIFSPVLVDELPGLNTLGIGLIRGDLGPGGINPLHTHQRASELVVMLEGELELGMVDTRNKLLAKVLKKGDVMAIPRGIVHYQYNCGTEPATFLAFFDSQNPGVQPMPTALFGSGISTHILERSFKVSSKIIAKLQKENQHL